MLAGTQPDPAETHWTNFYNRTVTPTDASVKHAREVFAARHPGERPAGPEYASIVNDVAQNQYNDIIAKAVAAHPGVSPQFVKSFLVQESSLNANVGANAYGYTGIAQLGADAARAAGLTHLDGGPRDPRNDPAKAIPAAVAYMNITATTLGAGSYARYGVPTGQEAEKFLAAAYNAGAGTIERAQRTTYERALAHAQRAGMDPTKAEAYAQAAATKFDNLFEPRNDRAKSPIYEAAEHYGMSPGGKYTEIRDYGNHVVQRAHQPDRVPQVDQNRDGQTQPGPHANARGWDGKPHLGTVTWTDGTLIEQHIGAGQHMVYDRSYDLAGQDLRVGQKYEIDARGVAAHDPVRALSQSAEVGHGR